MNRHSPTIRLALLATWSIFAAAQAPDGDVAFRAVTTDVQVDALVKYQGGYLRDLRQEDFVILEEGQPRATEAFEAATVPLDLVILIESADLITRPSEPMTRIAARVAAGLRPTDRTAVVWETPGSREAIFHHVRLTSRPQEVASALEQAAKERTLLGGVMGGLPVHWAAWMIEDELRKRPSKERRKQAMLLVSGVTFNTSAPGDPVIQHLWSINTPLHAILLPFLNTSPQANLAVSPRGDNPVYLAQQTGGEVMWTDPQGNLDQLPEFIRTIQSSYSLWFKAAQGEAGTVRHVSVELSDAAKMKYPGAQVLARQGYIVP